MNASFYTTAGGGETCGEIGGEVKPEVGSGVNPVLRPKMESELKSELKFVVDSIELTQLKRAATKNEHNE